MTNKLIYLLFSCNEYKEYSSFRLLMATTHQKRLDAKIRKNIKNSIFGYKGLSFLDGVRQWDLEEYNNMRDYNRIENAHIIKALDGEDL